MASANCSAAANSALTGICDSLPQEQCFSSLISFDMDTYAMYKLPASFDCGNNIHIQQSMVCDSNDDCRNGADEDDWYVHLSYISHTKFPFVIALSLVFNDRFLSLVLISVKYLKIKPAMLLDIIPRRTAPSPNLPQWCPQHKRYALQPASNG